MSAYTSFLLGLEFQSYKSVFRHLRRLQILILNREEMSPDWNIRQGIELDSMSSSHSQFCLAESIHNQQSHNGILPLAVQDWPVLVHSILWWLQLESKSNDYRNSIWRYLSATKLILEGRNLPHWRCNTKSIGKSWFKINWRTNGTLEKSCKQKSLLGREHDETQLYCYNYWRLLHLHSSLTRAEGHIYTIAGLSAFAETGHCFAKRPPEDPRSGRSSMNMFLWRLPAE